MCKLNLPRGKAVKLASSGFYTQDKGTKKAIPFSSTAFQNRLCCSTKGLWVHGQFGGGAALPVVHTPEELQIELVHRAGNLLAIALHQLHVIGQLLL